MDLLRGSKGTKTLLSSAIADALAEYFVIGADQIESNLFSDTKIVLNDVRLKPQHASIPKNIFGNTTNFCITGFVREVSLTWTWDFLSSEGQSWAKDAVLRFKGCRFKVMLSQGDTDSDGDNNDGPEYGTNIDTNKNDKQDQESSSEVQPEVDTQTPQNVTIEDKIKAFLDEQVKQVVNSLALTMEDFEIILEMPSPKILPTIPGVSVFEDSEDEAGNIEMTMETHGSSTKTPGISVYEDPDEGENIEVVECFEIGNAIDNDDYTIALKVGGEELDVLSFGRFGDKTMKEGISLSSLFINVTETFYSTTNNSSQGRKLVCKTYPLLETFSYTLGITRTHGERFSDIGRGIRVKGGLDESIASAKKGDDGLSVHLSRPQMEAIGQLSGLVLAPQEETTERKGPTKNDNTTTCGDDVSIFEFSFGSVNIDLMGDELSATSVNLSSLANGSDLSVEIESARYEEAVSETKRLGTSIECSNIVASILPCIEVIVGSVSELYVPDVVELRTPVENVQVRLIGATWTVDVDFFDGYLPSPEKEVEDHSQNDNAKQAIPFAVACNAKRVFLVKDEDEETEVAFEDVEVLVYPKSDESGTELACTIRSMQSKLASATNINTCMVLPEMEGETNTIRDFALSLDHISVTAGYTIQDWKKTFRIGGKWRTRNNNKMDDTALFKLPFASVAPLKTRIAYNALQVVSLSETTFLVKAYKGHKGTTAKDLLDFYTAQCLSRTPGFLENAELLGINVKSAGAFSLGAHFIVSPIGPFVGVAAVVGVDAVRGSIEAGKRSRHAKEGEAARVGDFFRGVGYSAVEATRKGKLRRNIKSDRKGNLVDWMVGATVNTGDYIGKNKDTLGSAGGAGAGVIVGTILAGPVGAVIGGVVGGMTTGTAIRRIDKRIKRVIQSKEEKKLKPGQLMLSPS